VSTPLNSDLVSPHGDTNAHSTSEIEDYRYSTSEVEDYRYRTTGTILQIEDYR